jgi:hypothetical protein
VGGRRDDPAADWHSRTVKTDAGGCGNWLFGCADMTCWWKATEERVTPDRLADFIA